MKAIILAAGVGSRLGSPFPKSLSKLPNDESIMARQIRCLRKFGVCEIYTVVGFKMSLIMESFPEVFYKYNPTYYITNTSKSLLTAIENIHDDIIWLNADVVFDENALEKIINQPAGNYMAVNNSKCGDEEVKYTLNNQGFINQVSKQVKNPLGEAVGINRVCKEDLDEFKQALASVDDQDYFEKGIEIMIDNGRVFKATDISEFRCIEVDFEDDLKEALNLFSDLK